MKSKMSKLTHLVAAALVGMASGAPIEVAADDTEIYTGRDVVVGVRPNVLFILDTSGSMRNFDGFSQNRLDRMKVALKAVLETVDNVNIGLMRFTDPGGPIMSPVADVNAVVEDIGLAAGQPDITVRVSANADDAEELTVVRAAGGPGAAVVGDVSLGNSFLELLDTGAFFNGTEKSVVIKVDQDPDDAEHSETFYNNSSTTLESVFHSGRPSEGTRTIGYRFSDLPADTNDATVVNAQLSLIAIGDRGGALDLKIFGLYRGDMASFSSNRNGAGNCPGAHSDQDIYCRLGLDTVAEYDAGINFGNVETFGHSLGAGNATDAVVTWSEVPPTARDDAIISPDIGPVLQEIFAHPDWQAAAGNNDLGIFYTGTTDSRRDIYSHDRSSSRAAVLSVDYVPGNQTSGQQMVAFRFRNVLVPQGAVIEKAVLELTSAGESTAAANISISGERVANAPPFVGGTGLPLGDRLSGRQSTNGTLNTVPWALGAAEPWSTEQAVQTPDIKSVITEIVGQAGWCGGNDLVIFLKYDTPPGAPSNRRVFAHDGDPAFAATLKVDFDETTFSPGSGCTRDDVTRRVIIGRDDAEQNIVTGDTFLNSEIMEIGNAGATALASGLTFRNIPVHVGSVVESAVIEFTANGSFGANAANVTVQGERSATPPRFEPSIDNITNRTVGIRGTNAVSTFSMPAAAVVEDDTFQTGELKDIVNEIVDPNVGWEHGSDMVFVITGTGQVDVKTSDADAGRAPVLRMRVRFNLGDVIANGPPPGLVTVRKRLLNIVDGLTAAGYTPIVDTMYEAARYYRGEGVLYGASRGDGGRTVERNTRVSHPESFERPPGVVEYPVGCNPDDTNLSDEACRTQTISGNPDYISPIEASCQSSFIVLLTDGFANHNHSISLVEQIANLGSCISTYTDNTSVADPDEKCGIDMAKFLRENDQSTDVAGTNNVTTYTIGLQISTQFLKDMAQLGGGRFFEASSAASLARVFQDILSDVLSQSTSFAAPTLSVNAFNRLEDRNEVYFSLFEPSPTVSWDGNIKKFQLCQSLADNCGPVGGILDSNATVAVGDDGRILDTAISFWSPGADGPLVTEGGAGRQVPTHTARRVLTLSADGFPEEEPPAVPVPPDPPPGTVTFFPLSLDLGASENIVIDADNDGTMDNLPGTFNERLEQTRSLLGLRAGAPADLATLIDWVRGQDVDNLFPDVDYGPDRFAFGDPLHGNPLAITFGGTQADPIIKLVAGTNDGGIRLINSNNGKEEFIFFPSSTLRKQSLMKLNPTNVREYGIDGTATPWIRDTGEVGVIDPVDKDFVRIFVGMRRGGNEYFGLDLTPATKLQPGDINRLDKITPKLMWRIRGGAKRDPADRFAEYARLGQTWSRPFLATMLLGTNNVNEAVRKRVLIFGGGYEPETQDPAFVRVSATGNAIYIADAETGERLYYVTGPGAAAEHSPGPGKEVTDMIYAMPSDVAAFDSDGDAAVDRIYIGDTGGQVWRVDLAPNRQANAPGLVGTVGKLAELSGSPTRALPLAESDKRKIFYPPSVIQVRGTGDQHEAAYDLVSLVTGTRSRPLGKTVHDRFYALRDVKLKPMGATDVNLDGLSDDYNPPAAPADSYPIKGDLDGDPINGIAAEDNNDLIDLTQFDSIEDPGAVQADPDADFGYYIRFETGGPDAGEKGLAAPVTIAGKLFFTTYLPEGVVAPTTCTIAEGRGQLYGIDAVTGAAIFNWDNDPNDNLTRTDRTDGLGAGIPSYAVPVFFPDKVMLLVGVGGGAESIDPEIEVPRGRTYWFQQGL